MNSVGLKQNQVWLRFQILTKTRFFVKKNFSKDSEDDSLSKEEEKKKKIINVGESILHDKQQSVKEESYFHKQEREQLESLKQKIKNKLPEQSDKDDKN